MKATCVLIGLAVGAPACGLGVGGVYGPKHYPAGTAGGAFVADDPWCRYSCSGHYGSMWSYGASTSDGGLIVGYRQGIAWDHYGKTSVDHGRSFDLHMTGYYGPISLAFGYTSDSGTADLPYGATTLHGEIGYSGPFVEPAIGANVGPVYAGFMLAVISGTSHVQLAGNTHTDEVNARGYRPGGRFAVGLFEIKSITFKLVADLRYLITPDVMLINGGGATPQSYGGWSTVFALNATL